MATTISSPKHPFNTYTHVEIKKVYQSPDSKHYAIGAHAKFIGATEQVSCEAPLPNDAAHPNPTFEQNFYLHLAQNNFVIGMTILRKSGQEIIDAFDNAAAQAGVTILPEDDHVKKTRPNSRRLLLEFNLAEPEKINAFLQNPETQKYLAPEIADAVRQHMKIQQEIQAKPRV